MQLLAWSSTNGSVVSDSCQPETPAPSEFMISKEELSVFYAGPSHLSYHSGVANSHLVCWERKAGECFILIKPQCRQNTNSRNTRVLVVNLTQRYYLRINSFCNKPCYCTMGKNILEESSITVIQFYFTHIKFLIKIQSSHAALHLSCRINHHTEKALRKAQFRNK